MLDIHYDEHKFIINGARSETQPMSMCPIQTYRTFIENGCSLVSRVKM